MIRNAIKKIGKLKKNNTILTSRVEIPFWTLLIFYKHEDIHTTVVNDIFNHGIFSSRQMKKEEKVQ